MIPLFLKFVKNEPKKHGKISVQKKHQKMKPREPRSDPKLLKIDWKTEKITEIAKKHES